MCVCEKPGAVCRTFVGSVLWDEDGIYTAVCGPHTFGLLSTLWVDGLSIGRLPAKSV